MLVGFRTRRFSEPVIPSEVVRLKDGFGILEGMPRDAGDLWNRAAGNRHVDDGSPAGVME